MRKQQSNNLNITNEPALENCHWTNEFRLLAESDN
jgi:hypothetical protein